jgi:hypothetical protein
MDMNIRRSDSMKKIVAAALGLVLLVGLAVPTAAATLADVRELRQQVANTNVGIMALMQQARASMETVRSSLSGHLGAIAKVAPEEAEALKARIEELRSRKEAVVAEREHFAAQMEEFRADMDAKDLDAAYTVLTDVAARQVGWKGAVESFIADADALATDIQALATEVGPIWDAQKAAREAFHAAVVEKKATMKENHAGIAAQVETLKGILSQVRERIQAGALSGATTEERDAVKSELEAIRTGVQTVFDGSVKAKLEEFVTLRETGDLDGTLATLDAAIAIQETRPAALDALIARAQALLEGLLEGAAPTETETATPTV